MVCKKRCFENQSGDCAGEYWPDTMKPRALAIQLGQDTYLSDKPASVGISTCAL